MAWNFVNDKSIYLQLVDIIQNRIATGYYAPGSKLASVRDLASEAEVNPNTMQKALAELERMGLVHSQRTSGRFVTDDEGRIQKMKRETARETIQTFLQQMKNMGFEKEEIIDLTPIVEDKYNEAGYKYEIIEANNCIVNKVLESDIASHDVTLCLAKIMDEIREQIGLVYPFE